jgi:catechol 2,3-dioxygenase-like lactoylglutathione lyase family enzyme
VRGEKGLPRQTRKLISLFMLKLAIPVFHVSSSARAEEFYCHQLGFKLDFAYRPFGAIDPCYMGFSRDEARFHASSFSGDAVAGGVIYLLVDDVDAIHEELAARGVKIDTGPINQDWGNREMYVRDPDRNCIRFTQPLE